MAKKKKKKSKPEQKVLDAEALARLISKVHLKGLIDECVLTVNEEYAEVSAIDLTNSIFLYSTEPIEMEDMVLGLGNLSLLERYFSREGEFSYAIGDSKLTINQKGSGSIRVTQQDPEEVPTRVDGDGFEISQKMYEATEASLVLSEEEAQSLLEHITLVPSESISIMLRNGSVHVNTGRSVDKEFAVILGKVEEDDVDDFEIEVYTKFLVSVLNVLDFDNGPMMYLAEGCPVLITQGAEDGQEYSDLWALTPIEV